MNCLDHHSLLGCTHDLLIYLEEWRKTATFPTYNVWKNLVKESIILLRKTDGVIIA